MKKTSYQRNGKTIKFRPCRSGCGFMRRKFAFDVGSVYHISTQFVNRNFTENIFLWIFSVFIRISCHSMYAKKLLSEDIAELTLAGANFSHRFFLYSKANNFVTSCPQSHVIKKVISRMYLTQVFSLFSSSIK